MQAPGSPDPDGPVSNLEADAEASSALPGPSRPLQPKPQELYEDLSPMRSSGLVQPQPTCASGGAAWAARLVQPPPPRMALPAGASDKERDMESLLGIVVVSSVITKPPYMSLGACGATRAPHTRCKAELLHSLHQACDVTHSSPRHRHPPLTPPHTWLVNQVNGRRRRSSLVLLSEDAARSMAVIPAGFETDVHREHVRMVRQQEQAKRDAWHRHMQDLMEQVGLAMGCHAMPGAKLSNKG